MSRVPPSNVAAPLVSIIVPTYRHRDYVIRTLQSVRAQTFTDYELIVVNDGSPDDTEAVLEPLLRDGTITRYIRQPNAGQGAARNRGIGESRGEFLQILDDDDLIPPDKLAWQVDILRSRPEVGVVYGFPQPVDEHGDATPPRDAYNRLPDWPFDAPTGDVYTPMTRRCWLVSPGQALIRRAVLAGEMFDPAIRGCDDWDLWLRIAERWQFHFEKRVALFYRLHRGNASRDTLAMRRNDFLLLKKHLLRNLRVPGRLILIARRYGAFLSVTPTMMLEQAERDLGDGSHALAHAKLDYAARFRPHLWLSPRFRSLVRAAKNEVA